MKTFNQFEKLEIGQRAEYISDQEWFNQRTASLGIKCWVEKRKKELTESDKALKKFIDLPMGYSLHFGITYNGNDFNCGDVPRDLSYVVRGIGIAQGLIQPNKNPTS